MATRDLPARNSIVHLTSVHTKSTWLHQPKPDHPVVVPALHADLEQHKGRRTSAGTCSPFVDPVSPPVMSRCCESRPTLAIVKRGPSESVAATSRWPGGAEESNREFSQQ